MHAEVSLRIKVTVRDHPSFTPIPKCLTLLSMEQCNDPLLIEHISLFAHVRMLHLVEWLLEELLVLSDQELSYRL